ncbi:MAG: hypothetical protein HDS71_01540 [Bacteroidales bacterium]|nr:hypothetical protein [Bacteroidales bacterium]
MIDYTDVDAKLEEYSEVFDIYMESGEMPPTMPEEDCLAGYMKEVIDNNPQIDGTDTTWVEVLKDGLISYFAALLEQFRAMQLEAMKELALIAKFQGAGIEDKRSLWQTVCGTIQKEYSKYEVNLQGYINQFQTTDKQSVFDALTGDWEAACKENLNRRERQALERSKKNFENYSRNAGTSDYEDKKKIDNYLHRYPKLKEIVDMIGRDTDPSKDERDSIIYKYLPETVAKNSSAEEIDRVETGDNLERALPVEFSLPEDLFFKRYATKELQQFSSPGKDKPKKVEEHRNDPRLTKGPIIVSIDTSGSMSGQPQQIAFSLLKQLIRMAKKQKRSCYLITFSVRSKSIDLAKPRNWNRVDSFLENSFSGGTDGEQMLGEAIRLLQKGTYEMADILIISDFEFPEPVKETMEKINKEKTLGTRFYGLRIGHYGTRAYETKVLDKMWTV